MRATVATEAHATRGRADTGFPARPDALCLRQMEAALPVRLRKLIGMLALIALVVIYALVASAVAVTTLAESSAWVHLVFFALSGLAWVLPAMGIIWWMARPGKTAEN